jgi:hypothetical protein
LVLSTLRDFVTQEFWLHPPLTKPVSASTKSPAEARFSCWARHATYGAMRSVTVSL